MIGTTDAGDSTHPDGESKAGGPRAAWLLVPVLWVLVSMLSAVRGGRAIVADGRVEVIPARQIFVDNLAAYAWWALLSPLIVLVVVRIAAWRAHPAVRAAAQIAAGAAFNLLYFSLRTRLPLPGLKFNLAPGWPGLASILPGTVAIYALIAGGALLLAGHARALAREREAAALALRASRLEAQLSGARLEVLRAQLHPHFLYNSLHAVAALVDWQPAEARRMLARLSDLLRSALEASERAEISLAREVEWMEGYVELQQIRFDERLRVEMSIAPETLGACVPPLILQPLVENAIRYAVEPRPEGGRVEVRAERDGAWLRLVVRDDGPGPDAAVPGGSGGIGLRNTRERLRTLYGDRQDVVLRAAPAGGAEALLRLPFRTAPAEPGVSAAAVGGWAG
ncbi:sensor histidine kinase [Longimicrobium sp.]|uniref:sensor histidine kinase n=1 Tax=Longimicrobium sp. TaxID=2029185 RepID=UPI003B3A5EB0